MEPEDELQAVSDALQASKRTQLQAEVICSAMKTIRENPSTSIPEALEYALKDWDI